MIPLLIFICHAYNAIKNAINNLATSRRQHATIFRVTQSIRVPFLLLLLSLLLFLFRTLSIKIRSTLIWNLFLEFFPATQIDQHVRNAMTCRLSSVISIDYHVMVECVTDHLTNADECTFVQRAHCWIRRDMRNCIPAKMQQNAVSRDEQIMIESIASISVADMVTDPDGLTYTLHSFAAIHLLTNRFPWHIKWKKKKMKNISLNRLHGSRQHNVLLSIIIVIRRNHTIHKPINYFVYRFNTFRSRRRVRHDSVCA